MALDLLFQEVDNLFGVKPAKGVATYVYVLGRFPNGWQFSVVDDWHKWMDKGLKDTFGLYPTSAGAIWAFLDYVKANKIPVKNLRYRGTKSRKTKFV